MKRLSEMLNKKRIIKDGFMVRLEDKQNLHFKSLNEF